MEFAEAIMRVEMDTFFLYAMQVVQVKHKQWFFRTCAYSKIVN